MCDGQATSLSVRHENFVACQRRLCKSHGFKPSPYLATNPRSGGKQDLSPLAYPRILCWTRSNSLHPALPRHQLSSRTVGLGSAFPRKGSASLHQLAEVLARHHIWQVGPTLLLGRFHGPLRWSYPINGVWTRGARPEVQYLTPGFPGTVTRIGGGCVGMQRIWDLGS